MPWYFIGLCLQTYASLSTWSVNGVNSASSITVELVATVFKVPVRGQQCWISQQIGQNARIRCRQARLTAVYAARAVYAVTAV